MKDCPQFQPLHVSSGNLPSKNGLKNYSDLFACGNLFPFKADCWDEKVRFGSPVWGFSKWVQASSLVPMMFETW